MNISIPHRERVTWLTAAPLWTEATAAPGASGRIGAPAILRFAGDDFMDQALATLSGRPDTLTRFVARQESWQNEQAGWESTPGTAPITLYQPIHNRYYLATATLVCQRPGLPDRALERVAGDSTALLIRRLVPRGTLPVDPANSATFAEQAWVGTAQQGRWVTTNTPDLPAAGEERLPMFPLPYKDGDRRRCLHGAVIPVSRANGYDTAPGPTEARASAAESVNDPLGDPRTAELSGGVLDGLSMLSRLTTPPVVPGDIMGDLRLQSRISLVLALLDLGVFLKREAPAVLAALRGGGSTALSPAELSLVARFTLTFLAGGFSAAQSLVRALDREDHLQSGTPPPSLLDTVLGTNPGLAQIGTFASALLSGGTPLIDLITPVLSDPRTARLRDQCAGAAARIAAEAELSGDEGARIALLLELLELDALLARELPDLAATLPDGRAASANDAGVLALFASPLVAGITWAAALKEARAKAPELLAGTRPGTVLSGTATVLIAAATGFFGSFSATVEPSVTARPLPATPPENVTSGALPPPAIYVLRTIYEKPACAGVHPPTLSAPSRAFHLAGFYDANAPVRALSIEMPTRTSVADFRNTPRNVTIQLSRELRKQISRVRSAPLSDPLEDNLGGGGSFDLGVICSLSIPIITICALILLMIIVQLLNIVFWWLPYFMLCFPVRKS